MFESFCGVGSFRMAMRNLHLDFNVVGVSEVDRYALLAYNAIHNEQNNVIEPDKDSIINYIKNKNICYNFSTKEQEIPNKESDLKAIYNASVRCNNYGDIRVIDSKKLPKFNLFTYQFSCKNISVCGNMAGFEKGSNTQSSLVWDCQSIIEDVRPEFLIMENVKNIVGDKNISTFKEWIALLGTYGYNSYWKVLNAKDFGIPQNRERVIMVSIRNDIDKGFEFPEPIALESFVKDYIEHDFDKKYLLKEDWQKSFNKKTMEVESESIKFSCNRKVNDARDKCVIQTIMAASGTGGNNQPKIYYEDDGIGILRKITPLESWRLMGFQDEDYYKAKNIGRLQNSHLYERAGRGIAIGMLEKIFLQLSNIYPEYFRKVK